jgi:hypothetical protein
MELHVAENYYHTLGRCGATCSFHCFCPVCLALINLNKRLSQILVLSTANLKKISIEYTLSVFRVYLVTLTNTINRELVESLHFMTVDISEHAGSSPKVMKNQHAPYYPMTGLLYNYKRFFL